ncbi:MAG TPA: hypothetical protein VFX49_12025 [Chloroflexota bacterium]|nr:hypothetical protein [Chloroflexota bacterium]
MAMILEPERAAQLVADRLARPAAGGAGAEALKKDWIVRRTLEELGIHCEADAGLQDLKGFMIASPRGAEIVVSERLGQDERLGVYAHLLAHALLEQGEEGEEGSFFSRLEYVEGREPAERKGSERKLEMVADALAAAILRGRLDGTPRYAYRHKREVGAAGLRPRLGRFWLELCHRVSLMLFWHSPKYQRLRARREMSYLVRRVEHLVRTAYAC